MKYEVRIYGHSDDCIELTIFEDNKVVFGEEYGENKNFRVNDAFTIFMRFGQKGWELGVTDVDEDKKDEQMTVKMEMTFNKNGYSPMIILHAETLVIEGVYGGRLTELKRQLRNIHSLDEMSDGDLDHLIEKMREKDLLKL